MKKQTVEFAVTRGNNNIIKVGRSAMFQPKPNFKGGAVKVYENKTKEKKG